RHRRAPARRTPGLRRRRPLRGAGALAPRTVACGCARRARTGDLRRARPRERREAQPARVGTVPRAPRRADGTTGCGLEPAFRVRVECGEQPRELQELPFVAPALEHGQAHFTVTTIVPSRGLREQGGAKARSTLDPWRSSSLTSDIRASST